MKQASRKKIHIIEDESDLCMLLREYFVRKNYEVTCAHSLNKGMATLYEISPDILFLDDNLPDGTGWNHANNIARDMPDMFIVLISAFRPVVPDMPTGAKFQVIEKPISMAELNKQFAEF